MAVDIRNFKIYKLSERLEIFVHRVTEKFPVEEKFRTINQLRRSSSSATNNISEGYYRYHYGDKINKFCIARGEAGETKNGIIAAYKKGMVSKKIAYFTNDKYVELIKGINGYIRFLRKQSEIK